MFVSLHQVVPHGIIHVPLNKNTHACIVTVHDYNR